LDAIKVPKFPAPSSLTPSPPRPPLRRRLCRVHAITDVRPTFTATPGNRAVPLLLRHHRLTPPPSPPSPSCFYSAFSITPGTKLPPPRSPPPSSPPRSEPRHSPGHHRLQVHTTQPSLSCQEPCHPLDRHRCRIHLQQFSKPSPSLFSTSSINSVCLYDYA
jgi:hypothetical protein